MNENQEGSTKYFAIQNLDKLSRLEENSVKTIKVILVCLTYLVFEYILYKNLFPLNTLKTDKI